MFRDGGGKSKAVTKVFDTVLDQRYPGWTVALRECVASPQPQHDVCWAEVHKGPRYQQVEVGIDLSTSSPVPSAATPHKEWTRKPYRVAYSAGTGVANAPVYDWKYLMETNNGPGATILDADSAVGSSPRLFTFHCTGTSRKVTCRNVVGDALTYRPASFG